MFKTLKLFLGGLPFASIKNYALIGLVISVTVMYLLWQNEKMAHKLTTQAYEAFQDKVATEYANRRDLNIKLDAINAKNQENLQKDYDRIKLDNVSLKRKLQDEINRTGSLLNDVQLYQDRTFGDGLSKDELPSIISTEGSRDSTRTIAILTEAGQSCAIDYNALYDAWMAHCDTYGCK